MKLRSPALGPGNKMPPKCTREGGNLSPPLCWSEVPRGTRELVLICEARDASRGSHPVHWLVYEISPRKHSLPEGTTDGCALGLNSWGLAKYKGPESPQRRGRRHYRFRLYALKRPLELKPPVIREVLNQAMEGYVLARAELVAVCRK